MPWPWLAIVAKNVPWGEIVKRTPDIINASKRLLEKDPGNTESENFSNTEPLTLEQLSYKVQQLEKDNTNHARLLAQSIEQLQNVGTGMEVLAARNRFLMWCVAGLVLAFVVRLFV